MRTAGAPGKRSRRGIRFGGTLLLAAVAAVFVAATPARAATWTFATTDPMLLGVSVAGSFSGSDANADLLLDASEVASFSAAYTGSPPTTSSFSIVKSALDFGDSFSFDLGTGLFSFAVGDAAGRSIAGGTQSSTFVIGNANEIDAGGAVAVSIAAVPEPASAGLLALGLVGLGIATRVNVRRKRGG